MNRTIGERLKSKRQELNLSIEKVSSELKIRPEFIKALERDDFSVFSSDLYAKGFIKNYSKFLGLDSESFTAVYRRDIESTKLKVKKDKVISESASKSKIFFGKQKFKYLLVVFFSVFSLLVLLSLINKAFEPPNLNLKTPFTINASGTYEYDYYDKTVKFTGEIDSNTVLKVNGIIVSAKTDNTFESDLLPVTEEQNHYVIESISNVGVVSRIEIILNKKTAIIEETKGINGVIQITKDNALIKVLLDEKEYVNNIFFENDSLPIIALSKVSIETDKPENIKIFLNQKEFRVTDDILNLSLKDGNLIED